ncbi:unnamed protein product [Rhizoctonia solani]|uniref:Jacalin-type lectin domain-containing protein n=1 Tax=Rhizoctonia solani TaxID=456999 RepID=A0A8H3CQP8_9AGAM|nr:unnamed protein product [Rhizoctonia solani]
MSRISIVLLAACALCLAATKQRSASSGNFNVLSLSVNGLVAILDPSGISDKDKTRNTMYMGMALSLHNYTIVNVQQDFDYHKALYQYDKHRFRTITSGDAPSGSGLNTLSNYPWVDFSRIEWFVCSEACLTSQGFTFMRMRIDEGVYIDVINLEANPGTKSADRMARHSNIQQARGLSNFITFNSYGNAVIVFGNTNSHYTRSDDNIQFLITENGLTDAWVQATGGKAPTPDAGADVCSDGIPVDISCESVEKVLYRGSPAISITSSGLYYDTSRFLSPEGNTLANRNPIRVEFQWGLNSALRQSDLYGGPHGTWFNDLPLLPLSPKLSSITLRGGNRLDGITLTLTSGQRFTHGGTGGTATSLQLFSGEYITSVKLCWGKRNGHTRNFYAQATTNQENVIQAGQMTDDCATAIAPSNYGVVGTYGQDGKEIDQLGFLYAPQ